MNNNFYVKTIEELVNYLDKKGKNHNFYYHYTTWESFKKIYETKTFLLTRGNSLLINDHHECLMKGSYELWNKTFIGSFAFGSNENMAMWGIYGIPKEIAIRIAIPKNAMLEWVLKIRNVYAFDNNYYGREIKYKNIALTDVVYVGGKNELTLTRNDKTIDYDKRINEIDRSPLMTGLIKNDAWKYENEVRIKVELEENKPLEKIFVKIPTEVLNEMEITTGPNFSLNNDELYNDLYNNKKIKKSGFDGLINLRSLCSDCKYERFVKRQCQ